jgi:hypothetical protein
MTWPSQGYDGNNDDDGGGGAFLMMTMMMVGTTPTLFGGAAANDSGWRERISSTADASTAIFYVTPIIVCFGVGPAGLG